MTVTGQVTGYRFAGRSTLVASVQTKRCAGVARWDYGDEHARDRLGLLSGIERRRFRCGGTTSGGGAGQTPSASCTAPDGVDRPDRLDVIARGTGRRIASWPLIDRPARVVLFGGVAILSAAGRNVLYALRISDGHIAVLGVARVGDRPIIGRDGVVYEDGLSLKALRLAPNRVTLKFVPLASVERQLSLADRPIRTTGGSPRSAWMGGGSYSRSTIPRPDVTSSGSGHLRGIRRARDPSKRADVPSTTPRGGCHESGHGR